MLFREIMVVSAGVANDGKSSLFVNSAAALNSTEWLFQYQTTSSTERLFRCPVLNSTGVLFQYQTTSSTERLFRCPVHYLQFTTSQLTSQSYKTKQIPYHVSISMYLNILSIPTYLNILANMISNKNNRYGIQSNDNGMYQFNPRTNNLLHFTDERGMVCSSLLLLLLPVITSDTFPNKLLLAGDIESNPGPTYNQVNDRHFPAVANDISNVDLQIKVNCIIYEMKCARTKKRFFNERSKSAPNVFSKFKGSKVTLMNLRNSLFLNHTSVNKCNFLFEKSVQLTVSYSSEHETLRTTGCTFRNDGRKKYYTSISFNSKSDDNYSCIRTYKDKISYTFHGLVKNIIKMESDTAKKYQQ